MLKSLTLADSGVAIGTVAFSGCESLASFDFSTLTEIGSSAFGGCPFSEIDLPPTLARIGEGCFGMANELKTIKIYFTGETATSYDEGFIGLDYYFSAPFRANDCLQKLEEVHFKGTELKTEALMDAKMIKKVVLHDTVKKIGARAFWNCSSLETVIMSNALNEIGGQAFWNCSSLKKIDLPASLKIIGVEAFRNVPLEYVAIPTLTHYENRIFYGNKTMKKLSLTLSEPLTIRHLFSLNDAAPDTLEEIIIDGSIVESPDFGGCYNMVSVTLPAILKVIADGAFGYCSALSTVNFAADSELQIIGNAAFINCTSLSEFTLPSSVTKIGIGAFSNCTSLKTFDIDLNNTSLDEIQLVAFSGCSALTEFVVPASVTTLGQRIFINCTSLCLHFAGNVSTSDTDVHMVIIYYTGDAATAENNTPFVHGTEGVHQAGTYHLDWAEI